eukprot:4435593-Prymnesium_polylepis.1
MLEVGVADLLQRAMPIVLVGEPCPEVRAAVTLITVLARGVGVWAWRKREIERDVACERGLTTNLSLNLQYTNLERGFPQAQHRPATQDASVSHRGVCSHTDTGHSSTAQQPKRHGLASA